MDFFLTIILNIRRIGNIYLLCMVDIEKYKFISDFNLYNSS